MRLMDKLIFIFIIVITVGAVVTLLTKDFKLGLDLDGGAHLVYEAQLDELPPGTDKGEAMSGIVKVIERRVNTYGVSEPLIEKMGEDRVLVELPGIDDIEEAKARIGKTALIEFREKATVDDPESNSNIATVTINVSDQPPMTIDSDQPPVANDSDQLLVANDDTYEATVTSKLSITDSSGVLSNDTGPQGVSLTVVKDSDPSHGTLTLNDDGTFDYTPDSDFSGSDSFTYHITDAVAVTDELGNTTYWKPAMGTLTVTNEQGEEVQVKKQLTSQYFSGDVDVVLSGQFNRPILRFKWTSEGSQLSEQITTRLLHQPLGIFVDEGIVSSPTVNDVITDSGIIEGMSLSEAKDLRDLLNAGRIPVTLITLEEHDVSPTLGEDFVNWSVKAGIVGMILLIIFLVVYYRLPGSMASLALLVYAALVLAIFELIPVTLTLAGIAGFILSVGMAVDANVLIFERMKEEIRNGRTVRASVEVGFNRAWPAIRDSNVSTFITCGILYWMGDSLTVPTVKGFALTLFVGVAMSMFSAIIITRTFLRLLGTTSLIDRSPILVPAQRPLGFSREGR